MEATRTTTAVAGAVALAILLFGLLFGGGVQTTAIAGLADPGPVTGWGLPVLRLLGDGLATVSVGLTVAAAFLLPGDADGRTVSARSFRMLRAARWTALGWAAASAASIWFTVSDVLGAPVAALPVPVVAGFAWSIAQGQALALQAGCALAVAVGCQLAIKRAGAAWAAGFALVGVLPPAFTGHAAGAGNHQIATTSLAIHVLAAALWAGGLIALLTMRKSRDLPGAAARYSRLALLCFAAVGVSGLINGAVRLGAIEALWSSGYGLLLAGKVAALLVLGAAGAAHRHRTLPRLGGERGAFTRLAAGEVVLMGAAFGLAVALSRTPTPVPEDPLDADPLTEILGFPMPGPLTAAGLLGDPLPDLVFLIAVAVGVGAYLAGVRRLYRNGHRWPVARTASWLAGLLLLAAATNLGVARYAYVLFSVHMVQHMVLSMAVPILLVGGAPVTLALRALRRPADPHVRGVREWLLVVLHSRLTRTLTHPLVALAIYGGSLYGLYLGGLLGTLMRSHLGHLAMLTHFVVAGYLLFWVLIGTDPGRRAVPPPILVLAHFAAMVLHAFFGLILLQSTTLIAPDWYLAVHPGWAGDPIGDQRTGAAIAWAFGEIPAARVMIVLVRQWIGADEREQRRIDRAADRARAAGEEDDLDRYNRMLSDLTARGGRS